MKTPVQGQLLIALYWVNLWPYDIGKGYVSAAIGSCNQGEFMIYLGESSLIWSGYIIVLTKYGKCQINKNCVSSVE